MNTQKMLELADFMETVPEDKFDMNVFGKQILDPNRRTTCLADLNVCGTTCCIAGYVVVNKGYCVTPGGFVYSEPVEYVASEVSTCLGMAEHLAGRELGLTESQASALFFDDHWPRQFYTWSAVSIQPIRITTPKQAAARIRHMVETGE